MTLHRVRSACLAALLTAIGLLVPLPVTSAQAATCTGVWVVVGSDARCATSYSTGLVALRSAGFDVQTVGSGFVCRIDSFPGTCTMNSPYWTYFHSTRAADGTWGPWVYSNLGAGSFRPSAGVAEGWAYGSGGTNPGTKPPASAATTTSTTSPPPASSSTATTATTTSTRPTTTRVTVSGTTSRPAVSTSTTQTAPMQPIPAAAPAAPQAAPSPTAPTAAVSPTATTPSAAVTPQPAVASTPSTPTVIPSASPGGTPIGSGAATVATAGVVLAGGVGLSAWAVRRRRREP